MVQGVSEIAKQQNMKANMVLKYLRWRNTDARGECAPGYDGEAFDLDPSSTMPEIPLWVPVEHGQGGNGVRIVYLSGLGAIGLRLYLCPFLRISFKVGTRWR